MTERIPPHNEEAERSVLGAVMLNKDVLSEVLEEVTADDFYNESHREIFRAIWELYKDNVAVDMLTVCEELKKRKKLTVIMSLHELELAQKISDKILCVKDSYVEKFGSPDEIFGDGYIAELFDLTAGSFDDESGNAELMKVEGEPEVFVIAGNGLGRRLYHRLQREGIAFATGILYKNDWDYPVAKALAVKRIEAEAFEPMSDEAFEEAKKILAGCKKVICCKNDGDFGTYEQKNKELLQYARAQGKELELLNDI